CVPRPHRCRALRYAAESRFLPRNLAFGVQGVAQLGVRPPWDLARPGTSRATQRSGTRRCPVDTKEAAERSARRGCGGQVLQLSRGALHVCWRWCGLECMTAREISFTIQRSAESQRGLIAAYQCQERGLSSDRRNGLGRRGQWPRVVRGVYDTTPGQVDREIDPTGWRLRSAWLALLAYGPDTIAVGACALALHGVWGLPIDLRPAAEIGRAHV